MTKFLLSLVGFFFIIGMSILVMIFGWGLEVKNWGWIIGGNLAGSIIGAIFQAAD